MQPRAVEIRGVTKAFAANRVLRGVDLGVPPGRVTVLMGANGAGKSTLVKILCGVHPADGGSVTLGGQPHAPRSPTEALRAGVVTVHQNIDDNVVADLDVANNLLLDHLAHGAPLFPSGRRMRARARELAARVGLEADMRRPVATLNLADRQLVAIARALAHEPALLILDEPTSSLSAHEAECLFVLVERLKGEGVGVLYISHRMTDIRRLADRIVAMRDGAIAGVFEEAPLDFPAAVRAMLGHEMTESDITPAAPGAPVLELRGLSLRPGAAPIELCARQGEVIAVAGLVGSGKSALAGAIFGLAPPAGGEMRLDGRPYAPRAPAEAISAGVFLCARDRRVNAVVPEFDITGNITLPFLRHHARWDFMRRRSERATTRRMIEALSIVCEGPRQNVMTLSGGNQQKVVVGRWMAEEARVMLLDEPFQGVDIGARRDIGARLRQTAAGRTAIVFVSELDEALEIADRVVVMGDHTLGGSHANDGIDVGALMAEILGSARAGGAAAAAGS